MINPLATIAQLRATFESEERLFDLHPSLRLAGLSDIALAAFGMYAGICLWRLAPGAVKKAKIFLWSKLAYLLAIPTLSTIFLVVAGLPINGTIITEAFKEVVLPVISFVIWMAYLDGSKRVRATYNT